MLAKLLKRKESRNTIVDSTTTSQEKAGINDNSTAQQPQLQYRYQRPDLLGKVSEVITFGLDSINRLELANNRQSFVINQY